MGIIITCADQPGTTSLLQRITRELFHPVRHAALTKSLAVLHQERDVAMIISGYEARLPTDALPKNSKMYLKSIQEFRAGSEKYIPLVLLGPYETDAHYRSMKKQHLEEAVECCSPDLVIVERNYKGMDIKGRLLPPLRKVLEEPEIYRNNGRIMTVVGKKSPEHVSGRSATINVMTILSLQDYFNDKENYGTKIAPLSGYFSALR